MKKIISLLRIFAVLMSLMLWGVAAHAAPDCSNLKMDDVTRVDKVVQTSPGSSVETGLIMNYKFSGSCFLTMNMGGTLIPMPVNVKVTAKAETVQSAAPPHEWKVYSWEDATLTFGNTSHSVKSMHLCDIDPFSQMQPGQYGCTTTASNGTDLSSLGVGFWEALKNSEFPLARGRALGVAAAMLAQKKAGSDKIANMTSSVTPNVLSPKAGSHFKKGGVLKIKALLPPHPAWQKCCDIDIVRNDNKSLRTKFAKQSLDDGNEMSLDVTNMMQAFDNKPGSYNMCVSVYIAPGWGQSILYGKPSECFDFYLDSGTQAGNSSSLAAYKTKPLVVAPLPGSAHGDQVVVKGQLTEELKADGLQCCTIELQKKVGGAWTQAPTGSYPVQAVGSASGFSFDITSATEHEYRVRVLAEVFDATLAPQPSEWVEFRKPRKALLIGAPAGPPAPTPPPSDSAKASGKPGTQGAQAAQVPPTQTLQHRK